jgi:hypothetical protein
VRKRRFLRHLYIKCIILPRQARDEHRENSKRVPFSRRAPKCGQNSSFRRRFFLKIDHLPRQAWDK